MFEIIALLTVIGGFATLLILCAIDLREKLLPNEYVLAFAIQGALFHLATGFHFLSLQDMALGAFIGAAFLYLTRAVANHFYKDDTLGLGDVKLLGAAGIWLGPYYILLALTAGGIAGLLHGLGLALTEKARTGVMPSLNKLSLPAGPGFAAGIVIAAMMQFHTFQKVLWP
jgi:leader peptidase (prepilin peptidase)/N-methyltransferase